MEKKNQMAEDRSTLFDLNTNYRYTIGCQLSHTRIHTIIGNLKGKILFEESVNPMIRMMVKMLLLICMIGFN